MRAQRTVTGPRRLLAGPLLLVALLLLSLAGPTSAAADHFVVTGWTSWYGGPCDGGDNDRPAYGPSNRIPGLAMRTRSTRRQWVAVTLRGRTALAVHSDYGPGIGHRVADLNYTLAGRLGFSVSSRGCVWGFPTDAARVRVELLHVGLRYPGCTSAHRRAVVLLRRRVRRLGAPGTCLLGRRKVAAMRRFQRSRDAPAGARRRELNLMSWRRLFAAR